VRIIISHVNVGMHPFTHGITPGGSPDDSSSRTLLPTFWGVETDRGAECAGALVPSGDVSLLTLSVQLKSMERIDRKTSIQGIEMVGRSRSRSRQPTTGLGKLGSMMVHIYYAQERHDARFEAALTTLLSNPTSTSERSQDHD
jgi:hypothetical protein